jgi:hypothetical protein
LSRPFTFVAQNVPQYYPSAQIARRDAWLETLQHWQKVQSIYKPRNELNKILETAGEI